MAVVVVVDRGGLGGWVVRVRGGRVWGTCPPGLVVWWVTGGVIGRPEEGSCWSSACRWACTAAAIAAASLVVDVVAGSLVDVDVVVAACVALAARAR